MKNVFLFLLILLSAFTVSDVNFKYIKLSWEFDRSLDISGVAKPLLYFDGCQFDSGQGPLPYYAETIKLEENLNTRAEIVNPVFIKYKGKTENIEMARIPDSISIEQLTVKSGEEKYLKLRILPLKKVGADLFLLTGFGLKFNSANDSPNLKNAFVWQNDSELKSGKWVKIKTSGKGIHRIPYSRLAEWGFPNPQNVKIYGRDGYMLPEAINSSMPDGLLQLPVWRGKDGNGNDCMFFYSTGMVKWDFDLGSDSFKHTVNVYSQNSFYFLTENTGTSKDVTAYSAESAAPNDTVNSFDEYSVYELEKYNLIESGRQWFGDRFTHGSNLTFNFDCTGRDTGSPIKFYINTAGRASISSALNIQVNNVYKTAIVFDAVNTGDETSRHASEKSVVVESVGAGQSFDVKLSYSAVKDGVANSSAEAWLDYIRVGYRKLLSLSGNETYFRDEQSVGYGKTALFEVSNAGSNAKVYDVTDPVNIYEVPATATGSKLNFVRPAAELHEYVVFSPASSFAEPDKVEEVANQNLHGLSVPEMIIIAHPDFYDIADELADFHRTNDAMTVEVAKTTEIFNEFSSGMPDATGIRNFIKMLYDKGGNKLKYVLLFGDGSFDNRNINGNDKNFIPTYQSANSLDPTSSFVSDDYFVILDNGENVNSGAMDLGIGRIPASTSYQAEIVVEKVKNYFNPESLGAWRNNICMIGDDEDGSLHMEQSEELADKIAVKNGAFFISKVYFDAYPEESTPAGDRYPDVTEAINNRVKDGVLILNYIGHANDRYLAKENVLGVSDINSWSNKNNLPIFVTATCEFSRFDADETSAGEYVLFNPSGGGIGLFSTTRVVYAYSNHELSKSFYNFVFNQDAAGNHYRMGDIIRLAKVNAMTGTNKLNFSLLADPALRLSYPKHKVVTTKINSKDATASADTIKALNKITIEGYISDYSGNKLSGFNGQITPVVYDKAFILQSLGNGGESPMEFKVQDNIIYKGIAVVTNGEFSFSFMVPKDISYNLGKGKIIYYAENGEEDAHGAFENFLIGGSSEGSISDNTGPEVGLYLEDDSFVSGDETSRNPMLIAYVSDENGINTVGAGFGHDITAVIDDDVSNVYVLNDYYKSDINSFQSGKIEFLLKNLTVGEHTLKFKVWDVANNSTDVEVKFIVTGDFYIDEISNYPNPVYDYTYFRFSHNQPDATFTGLVEIFDRSGRVIHSFSTTITSSGTESNPVRWDVSETNARIQAGTYIYRVSIKSPDGSIARKSGKMNIIY